MWLTCTGLALPCSHCVAAWERWGQLNQGRRRGRGQFSVAFMASDGSSDHRHLHDFWWQHGQQHQPQLQQSYGQTHAWPSAAVQTQRHQSPRWQSRSLTSSCSSPLFVSSSNRFRSTATTLRLPLSLLSTAHLPPQCGAHLASRARLPTRPVTSGCFLPTKMKISV